MKPLRLKQTARCLTGAREHVSLPVLRLAPAEGPPPQRVAAVVGRQPRHAVSHLKGWVAQGPLEQSMLTLGCQPLQQVQGGGTTQRPKPWLMTMPHELLPL